MEGETTPRQRKRRLAILAFHKIGEPMGGAYATWNYVSVARFLELLGYLRSEGWHVVDLHTFVRGLSEPDLLPDRAALLTFDDGYRSTLTEALPGLRPFGYPAVIFVPTAFIGGRNHFDAGIEPEEAICDWDELRELERHGVSVQSHGVTHRAFSGLSQDDLADELARSKGVLETGLGKRIDVIAYPYGDSGEDPGWLAQTLDRLGYRAGCLYGGGPNSLPPTDRYRLTRLAIGSDSDLAALMAGP